MYHGTSQSGLTGIIRKEEIWIRHTQHFNDAQKFHDAIGFISAEINFRISNTSDAKQKAALTEMLVAMGDNNGEMNVCVCGFPVDGIHYLNGVLIVAPHLVRSWQVSDAEIFMLKAQYLQIADTDWLH